MSRFFLSLLGLLALLGGTNWTQRHTTAPRRPNLLFLIADDAGPAMSAYGRGWTNTPGFDRIAQNGLLFERAYTPNAKCAPSRAAILTGRNPWQLDAAMNHNIFFPTTYRTYPEVLARHGYATGYTGKAYGPGKALDDAGKPRALSGKAYEAKQTTPPSALFSTNDYAANFAQFLNGQAADQPWSFWVGFQEPHRAYEYQSGVRSGKKTAQITHVPAYLPDVDTVRNDLLDYAAAIEYLDSHVQRILKTLEEKGQLDNTLIVVTSDHGMPFPRVKGNQYEHSNHVPLAMMWPNGIRQKGRRIADYISLIDIAPTFLDAAGIDWRTSGMHETPGHSLRPIFESVKAGQVQPGRTYLLVGQERHDIGRPRDEGYPIRGIHKDGFLYLHNYEPGRWPVCNPETGYLNCDGSPSKTLILNQRRANRRNDKYWQLCFGKRPADELYDLRQDPDCVHNLARLPKHEATIKALRQFMEARLSEQGDLRMKGYGHLYEQYPLANDTNGFYERFMKGEKFRTGWVNDSDFEKGMIED